MRCNLRTFFLMLNSYKNYLRFFFLVWPANVSHTKIIILKYFFVCLFFLINIFSVSFAQKSTNTIKEEAMKKNAEFLNKSIGKLRYKSKLLQKKIQQPSYRNTTYRPKILSKKYTFIISPHPDDEILCCANKIQEKIQNGEKVKIIYFTDGGAYDGDLENIKKYTQIRRQESEIATDLLGLKNSDRFFLGFPDGELEKLNNTIAIRSKYTGTNISSFNSYFRSTPFTLFHLKDRLKKIFSLYPPNEIIIPSNLDVHPDHKVAGEITKKVLSSFPLYSPKIFEYVVHTKGIDQQKFVAKKIIDPEKLSLIQIFQSQFHDTWHTNFMEQFAKIEESFIKLNQEVCTKN